MPFFIKEKHREKRLNKVKRIKYSRQINKNTEVNVTKNDEITSSEDEGGSIVNNVMMELDSEDEKETVQEKKLRLAKIYLQEIEKEEIRREKSNVISKRLKEDYLKQVGKLRLTITDKFKSADVKNVKILKCREQKSSITCVCITSNDNYAFVGSKDGVVIKYSIFENKKVGVIPFAKYKAELTTGHCSQIFSAAVSTDGKFLATSDESSNIYIWDAYTLKFLVKLSGHKKAVLGLCFKKNSYILYSCSGDRTTKVWNLDEMAYVETLFGHQDTITSIDTFHTDLVITSGGRDLRVWKITEESQLIFNGHSGNIDIVKLINEDHFISGGDDGQLCIWSIMRKKPLCVIQNAHGINITNQQPYWITAIASLINTDLVATGSYDGYVKLWKLENNFKFASLFMTIPIEGFINSLIFTSDGSRLIIAVSKEHKLGRWNSIKNVKNCIMIVPFVTE